MNHPWASKIHLVVFLFTGAFMLAVESKPLAADLTQKEKADTIFRDFMARMVEGGEDPEAIDLKTTVKLLRWNEPIRIRLLPDDPDVAQDVFTDVLYPLAKTFWETTNVPIAILPVDDTRKPNLFIIISSDMNSALERLRELVASGNHSIKANYKLLVDKTKESPGECHARITYDLTTNSIYWGVVGIPAGGGSQAEEKAHKCLVQLLPLLLGWQNLHKPENGVVNTKNLRNDFSYSDRNWLAVLYKLPPVKATLLEVRNFIGSHLDELTQ